jgi:hypothetical protein
MSLNAAQRKNAQQCYRMRVGVKPSTKNGGQAAPKAGKLTYCTNSQAWDYYGKVMDQQETKHFVKSVDMPYSRKKPCQTVGTIAKPESKADLSRIHIISTV